jgi:hypothetical protein
MENDEIATEGAAASATEGWFSHLRNPSWIVSELRRRLKWPKYSGQKSPALALRQGIVAELLLLVLWTLFVTRPYLDMNPQMVPSGREYLSAIQTHHFWIWLRECGACALWNGSVRGGHPALVDPYASFLHPLVAVTTLGWGVLNGSKLAIVGSFLLTGVAQWWLALELGLGRASRMWIAAMAVAAGNLSGRMEIGVFGVVLSTAATSLAFPALIRVNRIASRRSGLVLGIMLAMIVVAGQGYMQIGFVLQLLVAGLLLPRDYAQSIRIIRQYGIAAVLALCLSAVFLVPFLHFLSQFVKDIDQKFGSAQPLAFVPINLVIDDEMFYRSESLFKLPYPYLYVNYVGWLAVILAVLGMHGARNEWQRRSVLFFVGAAFLAFWAASAQPFRILVQLVPSQPISDRIAGIRFPSLMAGLAIMPVLGLAGLGLDRLLAIPWPKIRLSLIGPDADNAGLSFDLRWVLSVPLLLSLMNAASFASRWNIVIRLDSSVPKILEALRTPDLQWVDCPFGEHYWIETAIGMRLKLATGIQPWNWRDRPFPQPVLRADRQGIPPGMTLFKVVDSMNIYAAWSGREYAVLVGSDGERTVCTAQGIGGNIDVICPASSGGILTIRENSWSGWYAMVDGKPAALEPGQWLAVRLKAGEHTVSFRYRPWDVSIGVILFLIGLVAVIYLWFTPEKDEMTMSADFGMGHGRT